MTLFFQRLFRASSILVFTLLHMPVVTLPSAVIDAISETTITVAIMPYSIAVPPLRSFSNDCSSFNISVASSTMLPRTPEINDEG